MSNKKPSKPKASPKPKKAIDVEKLKDLTCLIGSNADRSLANIRHRLETEEGLTLKTDAAGLTEAQMAGIKGCSNGGEALAIQNWANAARRALLKAA